jgi:hypothetical protein
MNMLRTTVRELVEKRLWPLAALLAVGLVAIPVLFLRPAPAALDAATPAATPAAAPAAPGAPAAAPAEAGDATADPAVALTSSPFAAAFDTSLSLPPAMQRLLKTTKGTDARGDVADAPLRDPFAGLAAAAAAGDPLARAEGDGAPSAPPAGGGSAPVPAPSPDTAPLPELPPLPEDEPLPAPAPAPSGPTDDGNTGDAEGTTFHSDVSFGAVESAPVVEDAPRLTAFPSAIAPVAVYLGVMRGGWGAVFALRDDVRPVGAPSCRPRKSICSWVILHPGEAVTLNVRDAVTGVVTPYTLKLEALRRNVVDAEDAREANRKTDDAGRCLMGPLAAYTYDSQTGTLALRPEMKACRYRTPDQPETATPRAYRIG